jgi:hypothetical protein
LPAKIRFFMIGTQGQVTTCPYFYKKEDLKTEKQF